MKLNVNFALLALLAFGAFAFAAGTGPTGDITNVRSAISTLCGNLVAILPVVSMLMVIGAGVVYAAGQIMGAETRARAATWATAMLIGAIIGIVIVTVAPAILKAMYSGGAGTGAAFDCNATW